MGQPSGCVRALQYQEGQYAPRRPSPADDPSRLRPEPTDSDGSPHHDARFVRAAERQDVQEHVAQVPDAGRVGGSTTPAIVVPGRLVNIQGEARVHIWSGASEHVLVAGPRGTLGARGARVYSFNF